MTTLNYTSTAGDPALDAAFERALATARAGRGEPLAHLIGGRSRAEGELFERADPCDPSRGVSRAHRASPEVVADAVAAARAAQPGWAATPLAERTAALLERLRAGDAVALVSDAGTPLISDPGYRLVRAAIDAGIGVTSVPGASAVTTALAASGLPPHPFRFIGFLPRTAAARRAALTDLAADPATLVAFEAPRRLTDALRDALSTLGDRPACLARNLTKRHERYQRGTLSQLIAELEAEGRYAGRPRS